MAAIDKGAHLDFVDIQRRLKWLMVFRVIFTTLLLGSSAFLQLHRHRYYFSEPLVVLYGVTAGIYVLTVFYSLIFTWVKKIVLFAYFQVMMDTVIVTLIIFVTGSFASVFSFLYLLVIIYSSILLPKGGVIIIGSVCAAEYGILLDLEFYGIIRPYIADGGVSASQNTWSQVLYSIILIICACYLVAFLSGFLADQTRKTRAALKAMQERVKRMERLAAVGEMAAGLTHEIKNPLASLTGAIQLIAEDLPDNHPSERLMRIVLREADRLNRLVGDFLMFAKPSAGRVQPVETGRAIQETVDLFLHDSGRARRLGMETVLVPDTYVLMDPGQFRQVMLNLLLNAADAIKANGKIWVDMEQTTRENVCVRVKDTGCGILEENLSNIFNPFFSTKPRGTGLGLSVVHRIVEAHGGWLDVQSTPGKGSVFILNIKRFFPVAPD